MKTCRRETEGSEKQLYPGLQYVGKKGRQMIEGWEAHPWLKHTL